MWDKSQVDLAAPHAGRVRPTACRSHGGQASRLNDADECIARTGARDGIENSAAGPHPCIVIVRG